MSLLGISILINDNYSGFGMTYSALATYATASTQASKQRQQRVKRTKHNINDYLLPLLLSLLVVLLLWLHRKKFTNSENRRLAELTAWRHLQHQN